MTDQKEAPSKLEGKILKQVEFYFSDSNLPRDKFLLGAVKKTKEGWVSIEVIASFKRMKQLTTDLDVVVGALKKSKTLLKVSEDGKQVRRTTVLPERVDDLAKSIYAKGLPADSTLDSVTEFFEKHLEKDQEVLCVRMRRMRGDDKSFKGSVFVEFNSEEAAQSMAKKELKVEGSEEKLLIMAKKAYIEKKKTERATRTPREDKKEGEEEEKKEEEKPKTFKKDLVLAIGGFKEEQQVVREDLKSYVESAGATVDYVDFSRGQTEGYLRVKEDSPLLATACAAKLNEEKTKVKDVEPTIKALEGEEETEYWKKTWAHIAAAKEANKKRKGKGRRQGGGGYGGKKQRR